jgi:NAD(P)-dependent dehydrogenase (short-subunit alcohol dehydrogenase family)
MSGRLAGQGVLVTGAAGAIGGAVAFACAAEGASVVCVDRNAERVGAIGAGLPGDGHATLVADLTEPPARDAVVANAVERLGRLDALVDCAAVLRPAPFEEIDDADWDVHLEVNVKAVFGLCRAAARVMRESGGGRLVLFTSGCWQYGGLPDRLPYCTTKGAVVTMARGLARSLGPDNITVNTIAPGLVDSPMMDTGLDPETRARLEAATPLRRFGRPEEIATAAVFLASSDASYVSGATLTVSGGYVLH